MNCIATWIQFSVSYIIFCDNGKMEWEGEEEHTLEVPELKIC
jgi:hypothetical protein